MVVIRFVFVPGSCAKCLIEWRLLENGVEFKSMKNKAIVYHLHHERAYSEDGVQANFRLWDEKKKANHIRCLNGIDQL